MHLFIWSPAGISNLSTREKRREYEMTRLQRSSCLIPPTASYYPTHRETLLIFNFANWPFGMDFKFYHKGPDYMDHMIWTLSYGTHKITQFSFRFWTVKNSLNYLKFHWIIILYLLRWLNIEVLEFFVALFINIFQWILSVFTLSRVYTARSCLVTS